MKYLLTQDEEEEEPELGTKFSTNAFTMLSLMSKAEVEVSGTPGGLRLLLRGR